VPGSRVVALGHYQPARVLTNDELAQMVETSDEWIQSRVGIKTRRIADDETVADMATAAAGKALANSSLAASDIDLVVVATLTAEDRCPNVAARVAESLGIKAVAAYDLNTACSGFVYALATVDHAIQAGVARNALVIGAEKLSAFVDWTDRSTCVLLGDGAGAAVVSASDEPAISPVLWGSVPEMGHTITIEGEPMFFKQEGQAVFRWATTELPKLAREACAKAGIDPSELAAFVPHQANLRIIEPLAKKLGAENAVIARDVVDSGNTSAASVPLALAKLVERREVPSGAPVLLLGFGGGITYAGLVIRCP
jgi:3-oxoacyl-[acyl-carrier-protein] synthase-3